MKILVLLFVVCNTWLGANPWDLQTSAGRPPTPPPTFAAKESTAFAHLPKVNVITGEYCEEALDLQIAGIEPLSIRRFYNHTVGIFNAIYGHWRFNPESYVIFNFEAFDKGDQTLVAAGTPEGSFFLYERPLNQGFQIDVGKHRSFTNSASLDSGQNHPSNTRVFYTKKHIPQCDDRRSVEDCWWEGSIKEGSGRERFFKTEVLPWPQAGKPWPCARHQHPCSGEITEEPLIFRAPFQALITHERQPNGNLVYYEYQNIYPTWANSPQNSTYLLKKLQAYSQQGTFLGSIAIHYGGGYDPDRGPSFALDTITLEGSDKRKAVLYNQHRPVNRRNCFDTVLHTVETPDQPLQNYLYIWGSKKDYYKTPFLCQAGFAGQCLLATQYDPHTKKVLYQSAPVGPNGEMFPVASYEYKNDHTIVSDALGHKTLYRYNGDKRITCIEKYQDNTLISLEKNSWDSLTGNLLRHNIEDLNGQVFYACDTTYDQNHNPILQKILDGPTCIRSYSTDGFNLKVSESDREGKITFYTYQPNTNILISELTYQNGQICKRIFHFYDSQIGSFCTKTFIDDGTTLDPNDMRVTYRRIIEAIPKRTPPCIGLPEEIQEKTLNSQGEEILLKKVRYTYHPSGQTAQEDHYDALGVYRYTIQNTYDTQERLIATTDPLGHTTTFQYDVLSNLIAQQGPRNDQHKEWEYDAASRPIQEKEWQTDGTSLLRYKTYDPLGQITTTTDESGLITQYQYDSFGHVIHILYPDGNSTSKAYDILGHPVQATDPNGYTTQYTPNFRGQPLTIHHPDGTQETFTYTPHGQLASHTDSKGVKTVHAYDLFDHPIQTQTYSSDGKLVATTMATYTPFCKLSQTDPLGHTTTFTYDYAGRKIGEQTGPKQISYTYDPLGNLATIQEGATCITFFYDLKGQLLEKKIFNDQRVCFHETYTYDPSGNQISVTTCGGTTQTHYDSLNQPIALIDPLGQTTHIAYAYLGGLTQTTTDPKGIQTQIHYDFCKRPLLTEVKNPLGHTIQKEKKTYDPAGNLIQLTHFLYEGTLPKETITHQWTYGPKGRLEKWVEAGEKTTHHHYDINGRLKTLIKPDGASIYHTYDTLSRLARYYGEGLDYRYTYDPKNRLIKVTDSIHHTTLERSYDLFDHLIQEKLDTGLILKNTYNSQGQRTILHLPDQTTATFTYEGPYLNTIIRGPWTYTYAKRNLAGKPTHIILPNQAEMQITYDPLLRRKTVDSPYYKARYTYDLVGNLTTYTSQDPLGTETHQYTYDPLNQLIEDNGYPYAYNSLYNRISKNHYAYSLNTLNQVLHDGIKAYTYDLNGNLLTDGVATYEYDLLDRLIAVTQEGCRTTYTYDALNRRIAKNQDLYIWDDRYEIGLYHNSIKELRILGEGVAEIGAAVLFELDCASYFPIHDHTGSLAVLLNPYLLPPTIYRYTPFGEQNTTSTLSPWRFASKRQDDESGLIYFGRRYYSPTLGRWITPDPQGFQDGPNLYAYVRNCPLTHIDAHGLFGERVAKGCSHVSRLAFRGVEWFGANLCPIPYVNHTIEGIGRWGAGGDFKGPSRYRSPDNEVITIEGKTISGHSHAYLNGMLNHKDEAKKQAQFISTTHNDIQVDLLYQGTKGLLVDFFGSIFSKMGIPNAFNKMCANYYNDKLKADPNHIITTYVHSRGGIQMMNNGKFIHRDVRREHFDVVAYGSATLIPNGYFRKAENIVSKFDPIPMSNPLAYCVGLFSNHYDITYLSPKTYSPLKEHSFLGETYAEDLEERGKKFTKRYSHE
jgi:RHS repeat-associated protein